VATFLVTGTDTGVGKTLVAAALLRAFGGAGKSCVGMKPVAAGAEQGLWQDVEMLCAASTVQAPRLQVNPYAFEPPVAPHIAAELAGREIRIAEILAAHARLAKLAEVVVVEGAGGFVIPLNARETSADLARALGAPVILVVGMRLGCLNHALLTRGAIGQAGLAFAGWVANCVQPDMEQLERNVESLRQRLDAPLLARIPYRRGITPADAASLFDPASLRACP
jgi:dethiobiotin synthetase